MLFVQKSENIQEKTLNSQYIRKANNDITRTHLFTKSEWQVEFTAGLTFTEETAHYAAC